MNPQEIATEVQEPHSILIVPGIEENPQGCHLITKGTAIPEGEGHNPVGILLGSLFVFNMHYQSGCNNFYTVLEVLLLDQKAKTGPVTVAHVQNHLQYKL